MHGRGARWRMDPLVPHARKFARSALAALLVGHLAFVGGCSDEPMETLDPPLAGLEHIELATVGQTILLSAAPTAVAIASSDNQPGARVVRFEFTIADGTGTIASASPTLNHVFASPGQFALRLRVVDDAGRSSTVDSLIAVAEAASSTCDVSDVSACGSSRCRDGACLVFACAGDPACPTGLVCAQERCVPASDAALRANSGDVLFGDDGARTALDAAP